MDKYGLAIYNENRVKKRLSTYLDCGGLASVIFPTMKSQGAAKNEANNAAQSGAAAPAETKVAEKVDFSNVKIGSIFTLEKSTFSATFVSAGAAAPD